MLPVLHNDTYQIHLPVFEGPLDLLLHLIEREKLDISTISLAEITEEFLSYVKAMETVQPSTLADFLVMAARLVYIKSRLLLPQAAGREDPEEEDPGEALARQLREYKRFRQVAEMLRSIEESGRRSYLRLAGPPQLERRLDSNDLTLTDLLVAAHAAFAVQLPRLPVGTIVSPFKLTIHDQIRLIAAATAGNRPVLFRALLTQAHNRVTVVVTLLAVLELVKRRQVVAEQSSLFGEIVIRPVAGVEIGGNGETGPDSE